MRDHVNQSPINGGQPERDEAHSGEVMRRKPLAERDGTEQDCTDRNEKRHQQEIGRAGTREDAE